MPSARKLAANRANALLSTGPRSAAGKERSRLNATRHGLAQDVCRDPTFRSQIEALAAAYSHAAGEKTISENALKAAAAEFDMSRIRTIQAELLKDLLSFPSPNERETIQQKLGRLQRYERRATSRRRTALRGMVDRYKARPID